MEELQETRGVPLVLEGDKRIGSHFLLHYEVGGRSWLDEKTKKNKKKTTTNRERRRGRSRYSSIRLCNPVVWIAINYTPTTMTTPSQQRKKEKERERGGGIWGERKGEKTKKSHARGRVYRRIITCRSSTEFKYRPSGVCGLLSLDSPFPPPLLSPSAPPFKGSGLLTIIFKIF